ncbi:hypothetical protein CANARDRAFT_5321 [[Candida] arabinofermentans NRRL YB-2248]|uniref:Ataxin-10 homolog n=1 Tax=[Candida] arabinofermentans NRRL YB-2248 TaxID=983967 RepID=A0A1E4T8C9_9ASCO|nr:hypothetical protein CANARDRAFT_5321 [[Candida] arabinofermentans NRRL YB-2248]
MTRESCLTILSESIDLMNSQRSEDSLIPRYNECLSNMSFLLTITTNDSIERELISNSLSIWTKIWEAVALQSKYISTSHVKFDHPITVYRTRLTRGIILFARNMVVGLLSLNALTDSDKIQFYNKNGLGNKKDISSDQMILSLYMNHAENVIPLCIRYLDLLNSMDNNSPSQFIELYHNSLVACFQYMNNVTNQTESLAPAKFVKDIGVIFSLIQGTKQYVELGRCSQSAENELLLPLLMYVRNLMSNEKIVSHVINDYVDVFVVFVSSYSSHISNRQLSEDNQLELTFLMIINHFLVHESFGSLLIRCSKIAPTSSEELQYNVTVNELLRVSQIILGSKDQGWDDMKLTNVCAWQLDYFDYISGETSELLKKPDLTKEESVRLSTLHKLVISTLDGLSSLARFNHVRAMLNSYKFLPKLIEFFEVIEKNTQKRKLKEEPIKPGMKEFPHVKLLIVEIITALVYENFENQELMRLKHGLELVLNNCNLDTNEPFIKERAILCIKYTLLDNPKNQNFVRDLEAQGTELDETNEKVLEQAGYEINIVDGKVSLKKSAKIEEVENNIRNGRSV